MPSFQDSTGADSDIDRGNHKVLVENGNIRLTKLVQWPIPGFGMMTSVEQTTGVAMTPIKHHTASMAAVPFAMYEIAVFREKTVGMRIRIEPFDRVSAM